MNQYATDARYRGLDYELPVALAAQLLSSACYYCGSKPARIVKSNGSGDKTVYYVNGIDRVNNELGYLIDNVVPCCKHCNFAKRFMTHDEFIALARRICTYQRKAV